METELSPEEAHLMWLTYDETFRPLNLASPCRQSFYEEEFLAAMSDPEMVKVILRDENGQLISMGVLGSNLASFPWISQDYFEAKFSKEFAAQRLFYFVALLTVPDQQYSGQMAQLIEPMTSYIAERDGWALFDCCELNQGLPQAILEMVGKYALTGLDLIGTQTYHMGWATHDPTRHEALIASD
jgi:hypothetical protein